MIGSAADNNKLTFPKLFVFFVTKILHLRMSFEKVELFNDDICERILNQKIFDTSENMQTTQESLREALVIKQKSQSKQADWYKKDILYAVCDEFRLFIKNIIHDRLSKKPDLKILELFEVIVNKLIFVKSQLLQSMQIHHVFHSNLVLKNLKKLIIHQVNELPSLVIINNK